MHVGGPGTAGVFSVWHHRKDHAVFAMQKRRFFLPKRTAYPCRGMGISVAVKSGRRQPSAFHRAGGGLPTPSARLFSWRAERTGRMMHRRKRSWLPVRCVLLAARTACTWGRNSPRCTTAAASCAETCCVPACPSGIIMVSFCKEVDPCEI